MGTRTQVYLGVCLARTALHAVQALLFKILSVTSLNDENIMDILLKL